VRPALRTKPKLAVAAFDRAAHHDHALQFEKGCGVLVDQRTYIHQRSDGDQSDLPGVAANLIENEARCVWMRRFREMAAFAVAFLIHYVGGFGWRAGEDG